MAAEIKTINDFIEILKRRKWSLILPAMLIFVLATTVALLLPPVYKSTSMILIEEQEVPSDFVMTTVTSFAEERLQAINQRIMSSTRLLEVINRFNLYADLKDKLTIDEIISKMRNAIQFETISADVVDRRTGRPTSATIAFSLSYEGENPGTVQQVANILTSLYLEENYKVREQQAQGTSDFLEAEMNQLQVSVKELDSQIARFKEQHIDSLPELYQLNLQGLDRADRDIDRLNDQLRTLREREGYFQSQLANTPHLGNTDRARLDELRIQLAYLKNRFSDEYPDVIKTTSEVAELEKQLSAQGGDEPVSESDNPAYIVLASQVASVQSEIISVKRQTDLFQKRWEDFRRRIEETPRVEEAYKVLMVRRNNLQSKHDDLAQKFIQSEVSHGLEREKRAERFTLIDPPRIPEKPVRPNRKAIILIGVILGLGCGVGIAALKESLDCSVYNTGALARATGFPVLVGVPEIHTRKDVLRRSLRRKAAFVGVILTVVAGVLVFHFFIMDLNVFWAKVVRKAGRFL